jgi:protein-tyrosine phosphatase
MKNLFYLFKNNIKTVTEFFNMNYDNYNKIITGLYLGNYTPAYDKKFILEKKIDLVINCSNDIEFPNFYKKSIILERPNFKYIRIALDDSFNETDQIIMANNLEKICPIIHKYLKNKQNIYIHCYAGMQRSATIVLCYLIYKDYIENNKILSLKKYYKFLKRKRIVVFNPDPTFIKVIKKYYKIIILQKKINDLII